MTWVIKNELLMKHKESNFLYELTDPPFVNFLKISFTVWALCCIDILRPEEGVRSPYRWWVTMGQLGIELRTSGEQLSHLSSPTLPLLTNLPSFPGKSYSSLATIQRVPSPHPWYHSNSGNGSASCQWSWEAFPPGSSSPKTETFPNVPRSPMAEYGIYYTLLPYMVSSECKAEFDPWGKGQAGHLRLCAWGCDTNPYEHCRR